MRYKLLLIVLLACYSGFSNAESLKWPGHDPLALVIQGSIVNGLKASLPNYHAKISETKSAQEYFCGGKEFLSRLYNVGFINRANLEIPKKLCRGTWVGFRGNLYKYFMEGVSDTPDCKRGGIPWPTEEQEPLVRWVKPFAIKTKYHRGNIDCSYNRLLPSFYTEEFYDLRSKSEYKRLGKQLTDLLKELKILDKNDSNVPWNVLREETWEGILHYIRERYIE